MFIHYHTAIVPNCGELKRMKNINVELSNILGENAIEVEFYPYKSRQYVKTQGQFVLSSFVRNKYYIPWFESSRILCVLTQIFVFSYLILRYRPSYIVAEMVMMNKMERLQRLLSKKVKLVFDIHGAAAEEASYQNADASRIDFLRRKEKDSLQKADVVICQSYEMKKYITSKYVIPSNKIGVYRCGIDISHFKIDTQKRDIIRKELGVNDSCTLFVYSGGLHPWQRVEDAIDIFEHYHMAYSNSKFLILTGDLLLLNDIFVSKGIDGCNDRYIPLSLPFSLVPDYLNACDVAFLLRHNHMMNAVASPTKLAEYLACGLPVITSEVAQKWVDNGGRQYLIMEEVASIPSNLNKAMLGLDKKSISNYAVTSFSLGLDRPNIEALFAS